MYLWNSAASFLICYKTWSDAVVHLYLLNSFIPDLIRRTKPRHGLISKVSCHHNQNGKKWKCNLCKLQNSQALQKQSSQILTRYFKLQSPWETHMSRQVQIMLKISRKVLIAQPTYLSVCLLFLSELNEKLTQNLDRYWTRVHKFT